MKFATTRLTVFIVSANKLDKDHETNFFPH